MNDQGRNRKVADATSKHLTYEDGSRINVGDVVEVARSYFEKSAGDLRQEDPDDLLICDLEKYGKGECWRVCEATTAHDIETSDLYAVILRVEPMFPSPFQNCAVTSADIKLVARNQDGGSVR